MAMNEKTLAEAIKTALENVTDPPTPLPGSPDAYLEAFSEAIIQHIIDYSEVNTTVSVSATTHTGTGTGSVTA